VTSAKRADQVPDIPTIMESGIPNFEVTVWQGYAMPKGTSKAHLAKVHAAMIKALSDPGSEEALLRRRRLGGADDTRRVHQIHRRRIHQLEEGGGDLRREGGMLIGVFP